MIKPLLSCIALLLSAPVLTQAYTINLSAGVLQDSEGTPLSDGALIQLIVSPSDTPEVSSNDYPAFAAPSDGSFTNGDDLVVAEFALVSATFLGGDTDGSFTEVVVDDLNFASYESGDELLLRWWPDLVFGVDAAPESGDTYGEFRTDNIENFSSINWAVPENNALENLNFLTTTVGGTRNTTEGLAKHSVGVIPEPRTYALMLGVAVFGLVWRRRRRR